MKKILIGLVLGVIITTGVVYAANTISSSNVTYNDTTVQEALDDLYTKKNNVNVWNNGNPLNLTLYNGCEIKKDEQDDYYLSFDGVDDYAQLDTLPATINWADGITIEFTAKWDAFNNFSRIFDFGVDTNGNAGSTKTISLLNQRTTNEIWILTENGSSQYGFIVFAANTSEIYNYKIIITKNEGNSYNVKVLKDNVEEKEITYNGSIINVERTKNYLGKSNYPDAYFKGRIYKLKIDQADGTNIIHIDVNEIFEN